MAAATCKHFLVGEQLSEVEMRGPTHVILAPGMGRQIEDKGYSMGNHFMTGKQLNEIRPHWHRAWKTSKDVGDTMAKQLASLL